MRLRFSWSMLATITVGLGLSPGAVAGEFLPPDLNLVGVRALGLGIPAVALTGVPNGETPYFNAALTGVESKARQKSVLRSLMFPGVTIGANATTRSLARAYFGGRASTQTAIENFLKAAQNEQTPFAFFEMAPSVTLMRLQWTLFARARVSGYVWQPETANAVPVVSTGTTGRVSSDTFALTSSGPLMHTQTVIERGSSLSLSTPYKNTGVSLGLTARPTWRTEYSGDVSLSDPLVAESAEKLRARFNETMGIPVDFSLNVRLPKVDLKPSFGLKLENVGDAYFNAAGPGHQTYVHKSNLIAGVGAWLVQGKSLGAQCSIAGHHLNDGRVSKARSIGGACEVHIAGQADAEGVNGAPLIVRLGGTKDGLSYGATWDMPFAVLEIASSAVQVEGPAGTSVRQDRRYYIRLSVDASQP